MTTAMALFAELNTFVSLVEDLRYNKRMGDFVIHCVKVIEGIWGGYKFLVPMLFVSVCVEVMELSNQVYELKNAVNALERDLEDDDSDDEGYITEEN